MQNAKPRALSLAQSTADSMHLGNYLGALRQWVGMQDEFEAFFGVANLHSLNEGPDPEVLRERTLRTAAQIIGAGVDPEKSVVFVQSQVPEHTQLMWVLSCLTGFGRAERMTQFKDKASKRGTESTNVGLFTYPILMAADILIYQADKVPVGEDQRQHLELTRDLAERFNTTYGETFVVPQPHILSSVGKIQDLQDPTGKMSKSSPSPNGRIDLLDDPKVVTKRFKSAVTDSGSEVRFDEAEKPGVSNLLNILSAFTGTPIPQLEQDFEGKMYGHLKVAVAETVADALAPIRTRTLELLDDRAELQRILDDGAERARVVAAATMTDVYDRIGLLAGPKGA
ncbi:tryptophan--tRNA ligase [Naumannella sp. ID2617S]|uniref:Tryptophan--tRNA ligase n=2 Tax=Enemella dayhoffiae TaxID=2016507 RepID=A0A255GQE4_9ACTN|nr:tryptophan--tRNA ligase [Naumannella sp. ID2617S]OYO18047.1 tryptophan--tRNA ligase [Enemella dayhoffiae]